MKSHEFVSQVSQYLNYALTVKKNSVYCLPYSEMIKRNSTAIIKLKENCMSNKIKFVGLEQS